MTITVHVDVSTLEGQAIIRELENHLPVVVIEPVRHRKEEVMPPKTYSLEETYENPYDKLQYYYGSKRNIRPHEVNCKNLEILQELEKHKSIIVIDDTEQEVEGVPSTIHSLEYAKNLFWKKINKYYNTYIRE
jgi:hypothetical protein